MLHTMRVIERFADRQGVTLAQFDVLANLRLHAGLTQQDLAGRLQVTKGNICGLIDRLEKLRWVERREDPMDRRANRLHLTRAGTALVDRVRPLHDAFVLELLQPFSGDDIARFRSLLIRLDESAAKV